MVQSFSAPITQRLTRAIDTLLRRNRGSGSSSDKTTGQEYAVAMERGQKRQRGFNISSLGKGNSRQDRMRQSREMYDCDARVEWVIDTLARDVTANGFSLTVEDAAAQAVVDRLMLVLDIPGHLEEWVRCAFIDGDIFLEISANRNGEIDEISQKPAAQFYRNSNHFDDFAEPLRAFYWTDQPTHSGEPPQTALWWPWWAIIHARNKHRPGERYGRPLFSSAHGAYRRMSDGEDDMYIKRKTRSGVKYEHKLVGASDEQLANYMELNKDNLEDPFAAIQDFFINFDGGISAIQGDSNLDKIDDVLHHIDTFGFASPVPLELGGYGRNLNRDVLEDKKQQYDESLPGIQNWIGKEFLSPLFERAWLLAGIWPGNLEWSLTWNRKEQTSTTDFLELGKAITTWRATQLVGDDLLLRIAANRLPDVTYDELRSAYEVRGADEIERLGALA